MLAETLDTRYIGYIRTSTGDQTNGLEAQEETLQGFIRRNGGELVTIYREQLSGKLKDRPELGKAIRHARKIGGKVLIAKLDRLSRSLAQIAALMESRVSFVTCDNPFANELTIHILGAMAQFEREQISKRTREGLAVVKAAGKRLGNPQIADLSARERMKAESFAESLRPTIRELQAQGYSSVIKLTEALNVRGIPAARGGQWNRGSTWNLLRRLRSAGS